MEAKGARALLTVANLATMIAPPAADLNETHIFNPEWPPHARFHATGYVSMAILLGALSVWLLWREATDRRTAVTVAAAVPVAYWGPFFLALLVPGAGFEDHPHALPRPLGIPINLWVAGVTVLTAAVGYVWYRRQEARAK
jgi:hypothetical protein